MDELTQLKAHAYDLLRQRDFINQQLNETNQNIINYELEQKKNEVNNVGNS